VIVGFVVALIVAVFVAKVMLVTIQLLNIKKEAPGSPRASLVISTPHTFM
jgi:hypothetical protein